MKTKLFLSIVISALIFTACGSNTGNGSSEETSTATETRATKKNKKDKKMNNKNLAFDPAKLPEDPIFQIHTTAGTIIIQLYKETPKHRDNFVKLASEHYYDSLLFHRVINGFMIQGGDPISKDPDRRQEFGTGGPDYTIPAEILPQFTHKKGALAAARKADIANPRKESSGSQFYIVQEPLNCQHLDGEYTIFGETIYGFEVIDKIATTPTDRFNVPLEDIRIITIEAVL